MQIIIDVKLSMMVLLRSGQICRMVSRGPEETASRRLELFEVVFLDN